MKDTRTLLRCFLLLPCLSVVSVSLLFVFLAKTFYCRNCWLFLVFFLSSSSIFGEYVFLVLFFIFNSHQQSLACSPNTTTNSSCDAVISNRAQERCHRDCCGFCPRFITASARETLVRNAACHFRQPACNYAPRFRA